MNDEPQTLPKSNQLTHASKSSQDKSNSHSKSPKIISYDKALISRIQSAAREAANSR